MLQDPERVFRSKSDDDSTAILQLPNQVQGEFLSVVARYGHHRDFGTVYLVTTIHPRPWHQFKQWIDLDLLLYTKKKDQASPQDSAPCN